MANAILAPAAVLVAWTFVMLLWLVFTRLPAMTKAGITMTTELPGSRRGADLQGLVPDRVMWKAHNYTHLHEQPTLFYAVVAILAINGEFSATDVTLAWAYVGTRIVHSVVQSMINFVPVRFTLFLISTIFLFMLTISALRLTL